MSLLKDLKQQTTKLFDSSIGATKKILLSLPSFHISTTVVHLFSTFLSDISLFDIEFLHLSTLPTVITFKRCNQFPTEIDSCCYGSDYVLPRNSCQLHFLVLTAFLNVIPVSYYFVPTTSE